MLAEPPVIPQLTRPVVVERVPRDAPDQGLREGQLIVSFRLDHAPPFAAGSTDSRDATVAVRGLGPMIQAHKAPFSTRSGRCLDGRPTQVLRHWTRGRKVTVTIRTGDGEGHDRRETQRVPVVPFNLGPSEQAYATTVLGCFSIQEHAE